MIQVLIQDVVRQHIERIEPATVADLFALMEADLPARLHGDLAAWAARARREIADLPAGARAGFVEEVGDLPPEQVPLTLREAVLALVATGSTDFAASLEELRTRWESVTPAPVKVAALPTPRAVEAKPRAVAHAPKTRVPRTPAAQVDPRRAEWIRGDVLVRLASREYVERGLKESILLAGIRHRSPYKDMTNEEILTELRRLERERKLKHTGERWTTR